MKRPTFHIAIQQRDTGKRTNDRGDKSKPDSKEERRGRRRRSRETPLLITGTEPDHTTRGILEGACRVGTRKHSPGASPEAQGGGLDGSGLDHSAMKVQNSVTLVTVGSTLGAARLAVAPALGARDP